MESRVPLRKLLMTIGTLAKIMEFCDKPRKLLLQLRILGKKTHEYGTYQSDTLNKVHQAVVSKLLSIALIKNKIEKEPIISNEYYLEMFFITGSIEDYTKFLLDIRDIGLPKLKSIGLYMNKFKQCDIQVSLINGILSQYYDKGLRNLSISGGSLMLLKDSARSILPKVGSYLTFKYGKFGRDEFELLLNNIHNTEILTFENGHFNEFDPEDIMIKEPEKEFKVKTLIFDQFLYFEEEVYGLNEYKIGLIIETLKKSSIRNSLKNVGFNQVSKDLLIKTKSICIEKGFNVSLKINEDGCKSRAYFSSPNFSLFYN